MWVDRWSFGRRDQELETSRKEGSKVLETKDGRGGGKEGEIEVSFELTRTAKELPPRVRFALET